MVRGGKEKEEEVAGKEEEEKEVVGVRGGIEGEERGEEEKSKGEGGG